MSHITRRFKPPNLWTRGKSKVEYYIAGWERAGRQDIQVLTLDPSLGREEALEIALQRKIAETRRVDLLIFPTSIFSMKTRARK